FRAAALPAIAALGGMVVPAALYLTLNGAGEASRGWGIPMATDIAFAVGIVALLGARVSPKIKLFLLTLAIVDDRDPVADSDVLQLSNFHLLENRQTGEIELYLTRYGERESSRTHADAYKYTIELQAD
ncbi:MAG TPA: hypothetical protein EYQ31_12735, partial [Candidatus Handelsmanbacteria bacterium]|nr:hypothetical protein [Candidatus Handelsmanbacteria bacterium]